MRPPALDELGLVPALRQRAATIRSADGAAMRISVEVPQALPELPAALETAAYRIATEALTNAARHSGSDRADLRITVDAGRLSVVVHDDGHNGAAWTPGVGLSSMRERAAEVGGTLTVTGSDGGFAVHALLPLP
jgi:signal transduction histidine kinase